MAKDKMDEMRQKLKLDGMEDVKKKEIFNKFVQAGGQVIDLNKKVKKEGTEIIKSPITDKGTFKKESERTDNKRIVYTEAKPVFNKKNIEMDLSQKNKKNNPVNKWIEYLSAKLGCVFSGIISFRGDDFKQAFKDLILTNFQNMLLNSRMILASILYQDNYVATEIKKRFFMDTNFPFYFELIYRFDKIYDDELFKQLSLMRQSSQPVKYYQKHLTGIFKSVFILQPYYFSLKTGIETALLTEKEIRKLDSNITYQNLRKMNGYIDFIFIKIYPKLFALIDYYYKLDSKVKNISFNDYLDFQEEDYIGYYNEKWKEDLAEEVKKNQVQTLKQASSITELKDEIKNTNETAVMDDKNPIKKGFSIIENTVKFNDILNFYKENKDIRSLFSIKDKVFLSSCLIDFFDKEFSFIFSSNKVEFNVVFLEGKRIDIKRDLMDTHYKVSGILERVNEYIKVIREIRKLDNDAYINIHERSARSNQYSLQRSQISRSMRKEAREFTEEFSSKFLTILTDYKNDKKIIQNPETILEFDKKTDGNRYLNGKRVIDAIDDAFCFSSALNFLLLDGDLGGFSLLIDKIVYLNIKLEDD